MIRRDWDHSPIAKDPVNYQTGVAGLADSTSLEKQNPGVDSPQNTEREKQDLYVVTVNYETPQYVDNLVRSLEQCNVVKKLFVVDHSSHGVYKPGPSLFPIKVVPQPNKGYGAGINRGLKEIGEQEGIAFICNPDIEIVTPESVAAAMMELDSHPHLGCVVPAQIDRASNRIHVCRRFYTWKSLIFGQIGFTRRRPHRYRREHFYIDRDLTQTFDVDWAGGSALFIKLSLFQSPLSFDEDFFLYFEDVDFCCQLHRHGYSIRYYPQLVVRHHEQRHSHKNTYFWLMHVRSLFRFILKNRGLPRAADVKGPEPPPLTRT